MTRFRDVARRTLEDLRHGRHLEAYALFLIGAGLAILGLVGVASITVMLGAILLALSFLVFHTATEVSDRKPGLNHVILSRQDFGAFSMLLPKARDLRIYGPTAMNVLVNSADIRRFVLSTGGSVKVIVQDDDPVVVAQSAIQLDDNFDLEMALRSSLATLEKLASLPGFEYRKLPVNPGFSLVIVNAADSDGFVIFESHGFKDENIADRMHIVISRHDSPRWFHYWVARFDAMWKTASSTADSPDPK